MALNVNVVLFVLVSTACSQVASAPHEVVRKTRSATYRDRPFYLPAFRLFRPLTYEDALNSAHIPVYESGGGFADEFFNEPSGHREQAARRLFPNVFPSGWSTPWVPSFPYTYKYAGYLFSQPLAPRRLHPFPISFYF